MQYSHRSRLGRSAGALCLLGWGFWALGPAPLAADPKAEALLKQAFQTLQAAKSFSAELTMNITVPGNRAPMTFKGTVTAMKPNYLLVDVTGRFRLMFVSNGKSYLTYDGTDRTFSRAAVEAAPKDFGGQWAGEIDSFFGGVKVLDSVASVDPAGTEKVEGVDCDLLKAAGKDGGPEVVYAVGQKDHLIRRATVVFRNRDGAVVATMTNTLRNLTLNPARKAADFAFKPPKGARPAPPAPDYAAKLIPVGQPAPRFVTPTPGGGEVSLSEGIKGKKALLINFWFYD